jgi:hypothetical protein
MKKTRWMKECVMVALMALTGATSGCYSGDDGTGTTASSLEGECTVEVVNGLVQRCCRQLGPYTTFTNCTVYSNEFHRTCNAEGITCRTLDAWCPGSDVGHRFNMVQLSNGQWCFVQSTAGLNGSSGRVVEPCFADPNNPPPAALCRVMGRPLSPDGTCPCRVALSSPTPLPNNRNPITTCALSPTFRDRPRSYQNAAACETCCRNANQYYRTNNIPGWERWQCTCVAACWSHFHPDYANRLPPFRCDTP